MYYFAIEDSREPLDHLTKFILKGNKFLTDHTIAEAWEVCMLIFQSSHRQILDATIFGMHIGMTELLYSTYLR